MENNQIIKYRVFFPDKPWEDFADVDSAWTCRCDYLEKTGQAPYVHSIRLGGSEFPNFDG